MLPVRPWEEIESTLDARLMKKAAHVSNGKHKCVRKEERVIGHLNKGKSLFL